MEKRTHEVLVSAQAYKGVAINDGFMRLKKLGIG